MSEIIIKSPYISEIKKNLIANRITSELKPWIDKELYYLECNHNSAQYVLGVFERNKSRKIKNINNSAVIYALGLTDEVPNKPIRKILGSLPDVDYDISDRDAIKKYLVEKYGVNHVALIGTYSSLAVRGAIKDVIRQYSPETTPKEANELCKLFNSVDQGEDEAELVFFKKAKSENPAINSWFSKNPLVNDLVEKILDTYKNSGIHAGGIIITKKDIREICPVIFNKEEGLYVTQLTMKDVETIGLIKYDFLKVDILKILRDTVAKLQTAKNQEILKSLNHPLRRAGRVANKLGMDLSQIPLNDPKALNELHRRPEGTFQFGTNLAEQILKQLPSLDSIDDCSIITAIGRPGPIKAGIVQKFIDIKNGKTQVTYLLPELEPILNNSYGLMVYQEQIMDICTKIANINPHDGYSLIKAISKKDSKKIDSYKEKFLKGTKAKSIDQVKANQIWSEILGFAEYGFNKSHSMAYAITGYICAWMKVHFPLEFMSSKLTYAKVDTFEELYPKWKHFLQKPSMEFCAGAFEVLPNNKVAIPISQIRNVGDEVTKALVANAPYPDFNTFLAKTEGKKVGSKVVKSLIVAGAFDYLNKTNEHPIAFRLGLIESHICYEFGIEPRTKEEREQGVTLSSRKKKPSQALLKAEAELYELKSLGRIKLIHKEIEALGFSSSNYNELLGEQGKKIVKHNFSETVQYLELNKIDKTLTNKTVAVLAAVLEVNIFRIKKPGRNYNREMAKVKLIEDNTTLTINFWPDTLEKGNAVELLKNLQKMYPVAVLGKIGYWAERDEVSMEVVEFKIL